MLVNFAKAVVFSDASAQIKNAMRDELALKPVELFKIIDECYVLDGNHLIIATKELSHNEVLAHIAEFFPSKQTL